MRAARVQGSSGAVQRRPARVPLVLEQVAADGMDDLRGYADRYLEALGGSGVVVVTNGDSFVVKVSRDLSVPHPANDLARLLGRGGGKEVLAQGRLTRPASEAFHEVEAALQ